MTTRNDGNPYCQCHIGVVPGEERELKAGGGKSPPRWTLAPTLTLHPLQQLSLLLHLL
jgi:hypothetical protein